MKQKIQYHRLSLADREEISRLLSQGVSFRAIAKQVKRDPSTIAREVSQIHLGRIHYRATVGQWRALRKRLQQRRKRKLDTFSRLKRYVLSKLALYWSPEQIANLLKIDYPEDTAMRVSPETIYAYLYVLPKGNLRKELLSYLRQQRKHRRKRSSTRSKAAKIPDLVSIAERPKEVEDRIVPGHWEGDILIGRHKKSALGTLVERTTRSTILVPLKSSHAPDVSAAFVKAANTLPKQFKKSLTYDRGREMVKHKLFTKATKIAVYFCDPQSPWQRGTNENTNGLIRQFFPKKTDFSRVTRGQIKKAQRLLNGRPRKVLNWRTPEEVFHELLR